MVQVPFISWVIQQGFRKLYAENKTVYYNQDVKQFWKFFHVILNDIRTQTDSQNEQQSNISLHTLVNYFETIDKVQLTFCGSEQNVIVKITIKSGSKTEIFTKIVTVLSDGKSLNEILVHDASGACITSRWEKALR